jgi:hypothetical protein
MKIRITDSNGEELHKNYKEQLEQLEIKLYDKETFYRTVTIIENFTWDMLPKLLSLREPEWINNKSRNIVGSVVVSTADRNFDGDVNFSIIIYDGYIE